MARGLPFRERERVKFNKKKNYALHCRCPCGNVLKSKHEIPNPNQCKTYCLLRYYQQSEMVAASTPRVTAPR